VWCLYINSLIYLYLGSLLPSSSSFLEEASRFVVLVIVIWVCYGKNAQSSTSPSVQGSGRQGELPPIPFAFDIVIKEINVKCGLC